MHISNSVNNCQFTGMVTSTAVLVCQVWEWRYSCHCSCHNMYLNVWNRLYMNLLALHPPQFKQFLFVDWICFYCKMNSPHPPNSPPNSSTFYYRVKIGKINCFESFSADVKHRSNCRMYTTYSTVLQKHFFSVCFFQFTVHQLATKYVEANI